MQCPRRHTENREGRRFCGGCGRSLNVAAQSDTPKHLAEKILTPKSALEGVHRYEGTVNQVMGDGIMARFGAPIAQEDDV